MIDNDGFTEFDPEEDAIDFWESIEGMLVEVGNVKAVAPQEHGDLITVLEDRETDTIHGGVLLTEMMLTLIEFNSNFLIIVKQEILK